MKAWKQFEADAAAVFGAKRCWANSGERVDFIGAFAIGQCKLVKVLSLESLTQLAEEMAEAGVAQSKLGVVATKVRRGAGRKSPILITMTSDMFTAWFDMRTRVVPTTEEITGC